MPEVWTPPASIRAADPVNLLYSRRRIGVQMGYGHGSGCIREGRRPKQGEASTNMKELHENSSSFDEWKRHSNKREKRSFLLWLSLCDDLIQL
jgi:hypothetical protein